MPLSGRTLLQALGFTLCFPGLCSFASSLRPFHVGALPEGRSLFTMAPRDRLHPDHLAEMYGVAPEQIRHHLGNLRC